MGRKSCRSVQLLLGCSLHWRMHGVQSLPQDMPAVPAFRILSFCTLPSVLRALTGCNCTAGEAHSTPRKDAQDPKTPSSDFPAFTQQDDQPRALPNQLQWETPSPSLAAMLLQSATAELVYLQQTRHKDKSSRGTPATVRAGERTRPGLERGRSCCSCA